MAALRRERLAGRRQGRLMIRLSEQEREELDALAAQRGVSVTRLLVDSALLGDRGVVGPVTGASFEPILGELKSVRGEIAAVGNNLNQLAHHANTEDALPALSVLDDGLAGVRAVTVQLMRVNVRLSRQARGLKDLGVDSDLPGEDEEGAGSEDWWARRVDERRGRRLNRS
jgi:hypothetical protein